MARRRTVHVNTGRSARYVRIQCSCRSMAMAILPNEHLIPLEYNTRLSLLPYHIICKVVWTWSSSTRPVMQIINCLTVAVTLGFASATRSFQNASIVSSKNNLDGDRRAEQRHRTIQSMASLCCRMSITQSCCFLCQHATAS